MLSSIGVNLAVYPELYFLRLTDVTEFAFIDKGVVQKYFQPIYASNLLLIHGHLHIMELQGSGFFSVSCRLLLIQSLEVKDPRD